MPQAKPPVVVLMDAEMAETLHLAVGIAYDEGLWDPYSPAAQRLYAALSTAFPGIWEGPSERPTPQPLSPEEEARKSKWSSKGPPHRDEDPAVMWDDAPLATWTQD